MEIPPEAVEDRKRYENDPYVTLPWQYRMPDGIVWIDGNDPLWIEFDDLCDPFADANCHPWCEMWCKNSEGVNCLEERLKDGQPWNY